MSAANSLQFNQLIGGATSPIVIQNGSSSAASTQASSVISPNNPNQHLMIGDYMCKPQHWSSLKASNNSQIQYFKIGNSKTSSSIYRYLSLPRQVKRTPCTGYKSKKSWPYIEIMTLTKCMYIILRISGIGTLLLGFTQARARSPLIKSILRNRNPSYPSISFLVLKAWSKKQNETLHTFSS